jgi:16S rRNA (cytosine967-C5)-methyltransferase
VTIKPPRRAAFDILIRVEKERSYADILMDRELTASGMDGADRRLFTELVYGVLRRKATMDYIIGRFSSKPVEQLDPPVRVLLRLGLYQFTCLDRIPVSAAVNETVKIAREVVPRAAGFINAVLRKASENRHQVTYPEREKDLALHLSVCHSHPLWLMEQWLRQLGPEEAEAAARIMALTPPVTIRANRLRIDRDALAQQLREAGFSPEKTVFAPDGLTLATGKPLRALTAHTKGLFTIQDESSQMSALLLGAREGETVVDLCAAPGGKTTCLAELMGDRGLVIAGDIRPQRVALVEENARRLGISCIKTMVWDAMKPLDHILQATPGGSVDRILLDAPCSGLGTIRRNPEGQWWKDEASIRQMAANQATMLEHAAAILKPGGTLLYSTCTTTTDENEDVVDRFLVRHPDFTLEDLRPLYPGWETLFSDRGLFRAWPHRHGMDGFFAARLLKHHHDQK